ncbi:pilus assembly protein [Rubrivivax gelatinosus]|nr:pilus assembly protein [Rubrivivax gelatinosus]
MSEARRRPARAQRGLSIVELMVGMVIALIISLAAAGSARTFSASQRQGIAGGGTTANLTTTMATIKDDAASAGLGFFGTRDSDNRSLFSCFKLDLSHDTTVHYDAGTFAPVQITAAGKNDRVDLMFASSIDGGADVLLSGTAGPTQAMTQSRLQVAPGQLVLLVPGTAAASSQPCLVRSVTGVVAATDDTPQTLSFGNSGANGIYNKVAFTNTPAYNETSKDRITLLGSLSWSRYRLDGTSLLYEQPLTGASATLLRNVMAFRVQYGISATETGNADLSWQDATGSWATVSGTQANQIRALRVGIVVRNAQPQRPKPGQACEASAAKPRDPLAPDVVVEPDVANWACYQFRSATVVVPLRNFVW